MKSAALALIVLCSGWTLLTVGCERTTPDIQKANHRERAAEYFEMGQFHEALIEYRNVTQLDPRDADAHYKLALTYIKLGGLPNLQHAFAELNQTVTLDADNHDAHLKLGEFFLLRSDPSKARAQADLVLTSAPQNPEGLVLRGRSLLSEKKFEEGIAELKKAAELDPKNVHIRIDLARAYFAMNNQSAAEQELSQALAIAPQSIPVQLALGDLRTITGKLDQAESIYKQAIESDPSADEPFLRLTELYERQNRNQEAEALLQRLAASRAQSELPQIRLGDFYAVRGQVEKAHAAYVRATEIVPTSTNARDKLIGHYFETGKILEAETRVKAILEKNDKDLMGRFFDARLHLTRRHLDEAVALLQGVVKDEPRFAGAHHFLGVAFLQKQQIGQARGAFTEAVKLNPRLSESRTALAQIHLAEGSPDLALEQAQAAIQANPRNVQAAVLAGDAYIRKGDLAKAKQVFETVTQALPQEPMGPFRLGLLARTEKNDGKALAYFESALERRQTAIEPITQIVLIKLGQGKASEARDRILRQTERAPNSPFLYNLLGQVWMQTKESLQAEAAFKKAIEVDNSFLTAYIGLGQVYLQSGKVDQATKEYQEVLAKDAKNIPAHMLLGVIRESQKNFEQAQQHYGAILKLNPKFAPAANNLAWILAEQDSNLDQALSYAQTARDQRPDDPSIADTLGWVYYKKHAYLLAVELLREAAEKLPKEAVVHYHYGMAQHKNGKPDGAKHSLQAALQLNPGFPGADEAKKTLSELK